jgi:hypothetical protein
MLLRSQSDQIAKATRRCFSKYFPNHAAKDRAINRQLCIVAGQTASTKHLPSRIINAST